MEIEKQHPLKLTFDLASMSEGPNATRVERRHTHPNLEGDEDSSEESDELCFPAHNFTFPKIVYENPEAILRFSALTSKISKLTGILRIVRRETKILTKLRHMLSFGEDSKSLLCHSFHSGQINRPVGKARSVRASSKVTHLVRVYNHIHNHRAYLLDHVILYMGTMIDGFRISEELDYSRVLYISRQVAKCKQILLASLKDASFEACKNFAMIKKPHQAKSELHSAYPASNNEQWSQYFPNHYPTQHHLLYNFQTTQLMTNNFQSYKINPQESSFFAGNYTEPTTLPDTCFMDESIKKVKF